MKRTLTRSLVTVAFAGTLGFGAAQAVAAPAPAASRAPSCNVETCTTRCQAQNGPFAQGECWGDDCICAI